LYKKALWGKDAEEIFAMRQKTEKTTKNLKEERDPSVYTEMEKLYKEYLRRGNDEKTEMEVLRFLGINPA